MRLSMMPGFFIFFQTDDEARKGDDRSYEVARRDGWLKIQMNPDLISLAKFISFSDRGFFFTSDNKKKNPFSFISKIEFRVKGRKKSDS